MDTVHIGEAIKQKMQERSMSAAALAAAVHCSRTNIYALFKRKSIDTELLCRISKVLDYDFLSYYTCWDDAHRCLIIVVIEVEEQQLKALIADDVVRLVQRLSK
ncbi:MAG: helix-turn-helix domain-containing protein [Prevotellaceae bacterium]|jgi:transcriptional regulator with XRE-family HTH domain|nr:helix-turn-helix domain-containing protein [Prevotellaceae bacterium]